MVYPVSGPCSCWKGRGGGFQKPSSPAVSFPLVPGGAGFIAAIWKLFLFTQRHRDAAACCASANGNFGFPAGVISEAACKAASCFGGSVWALLHQRRGSLTICANRSSWLVCLSSVWRTFLLLGGKFWFLFCLPVPGRSALFFLSLLLLLGVILCSPSLGQVPRCRRGVRGRCCINLWWRRSTGQKRLQTGFMRELIGVQNKVFLLGKLSQEAQNGILLVVKNVPGQLPLALLNPSASREAGLLWKQEDRRSHPSALLCIFLSPFFSRVSGPAASRESQRCRGEGQLSSFWRRQWRASSLMARW